jgi:hypothetical protein
MIEQPTFFDLLEARKQRDAAFQRVPENAGSFMERALAAITLLPPGDYTGEDLRVALTVKGIVPHHHNAWGAMCAHLVKRGVLVPTARYVTMQTPRSHACKRQVYEKRHGGGDA